MKKNIGVIFGGLSVEHDVSIITGSQILENIDKSKYNITPFYIDKDGKWFSSSKLSDINIFNNWDKYKKKIKEFYPTFKKKDRKNLLSSIDCMLIAGHGTNCEDGKLQGLFDLLEIPYSSTGVVGSSGGMDKIIMKMIFHGISLPVLPYLWFYRDDWKNKKTECINKVHYTLDYPVFVKPANLGSSIGISLANNEEELMNAIEIAINYDSRILIEKGLKNPVEVNCSCIYRNGEVIVSELEEPVHWEKFLSFQDKYMRGDNKSKTGEGLPGMSRKIPASINDELKKEIEDFSKDIYSAMDCKGVVRIDYLLDEDKTKVFVNEINTIPGSFSFYLWEPKGISFKSLLDIIIDETIKYHHDRKNKILYYESSLLKRISDKNGAKL